VSDVFTVPRPRRNVEALLLIVALIVAIGANWLVGLDKENPFDSAFWLQGGTLAALALIFHVLLRFRAKHADPVILPIVIALNGIGLAMIYRLDLALPAGSQPVAPSQFL
jgi:hypothetical protein